jgi:hypothetical protein
MLAWRLAALLALLAGVVRAQTAPFATPVVEQYAVDSVPCHTTYRLSVSLSADAISIHSIAGSEDSPMVLPAAYQVDGPFGADIGGVSPFLFESSPSSEFDSWLTLGVTDGSVLMTSVGIDFTQWNSAAGLTITNGLVLYFDGATAGSGLSPAPGSSNVVVAQLTIPTTADVTTATLSFHGHTQDRAAVVALQDRTADWDQAGVVFELASAQAPAAACGPGAPAPSPPAGGGACAIEGDAQNDGRVDVGDLLVVLGAFGCSCESGCP